MDPFTDWSEISWDDVLTKEEQELSTLVDSPVSLDIELNRPIVVKPAQYRSIEDLKKELTQNDPTVKVFRWKVRYSSKNNHHYWMWYNKANRTNG